MAIASLIIAIFSLLFGAYTYFKHDKKLKEQQQIINKYQIIRLQKEIDESKKAMVRASVINISGTCPWTGTLVIKNYGKATAYNLYFTRLSYGSKGSCLPSPLFLKQLLPQEQQEYPLSWGFGFGGDIDVRLTWTDESGENRQEKGSIRL